MNIPESQIQQIKLSDNLFIRRVIDNENQYRIVLTDGGHWFYLDEKGTKSWDTMRYFKDFDRAYEFAQKITKYFKDGLPKEDIIEWYNSIIEGEDEQDIKTYSYFKDCLLNGDWAAANEAARHMDTFLRDGISDRIMFEIEKNLDIS